jgi:hypothetical protein
MLAEGNALNGMLVATCVIVGKTQTNSVNNVQLITIDTDHASPIIKNAVDYNLNPLQRNRAWLAHIAYILRMLIMSGGRRGCVNANDRRHTGVLPDWRPLDRGA